MNNYQVNRAGTHYVLAEIYRKGGKIASFNGNEIVAKNADRTMGIRVKARTSGTWQAQITQEQQRDEEETSFWILVDLIPEIPAYYVMPESWIQNNIHDVHAAYLERQGGERAESPDSTHHAISLERVAQWKDRWDLLGI